jgi:hypothetical protein
MRRKCGVKSKFKRQKGIYSIYLPTSAKATAEKCAFVSLHLLRLSRIRRTSVARKLRKDRKGGAKNRKE